MRTRDIARRGRTRGFTLLELLAVVALLGIVLFFVVPKLDNITPGARLKAAARKIGSTMELAQGQAIATGKEHVLAYDVTKGTLWIILPPPDDPNAPKPGSPAAATDPNAPQPPLPDVEHDPKPAVTTAAKKDGSATAPPPTSTTNYQGRETVVEDSVGDDIVMASISFPNQQEVSSGVTYVKFAALGNDGSHAVFLRLKTSGSGANPGDATMSVRFNALTRTVDFGTEKLGWSPIGGN